MDVNGTKYHLLYGYEDWGQCLLENETLTQRWNAMTYTPLEWDCASSSLRLAREVPLFRLLSGQKPAQTFEAQLAKRRGAACDPSGNWYWIDAQESSIRCLPKGANASQLFWSFAEQNTAYAASDTTAFTVCQLPQLSSLLLRGLAVTAQHYLIVGNVTEHSLLIFDLQSGMPPSLLRWPAHVDFTPWDIAATPEGGILILDREHKTYWLLDEHLRLPADAINQSLSPFQPIENGQGIVYDAPHYQGYPLTQLNNPISIEPGPYGHVLLLDANSALGYSTIYAYQGAKQLAAYSLHNAVIAQDPTLGEGIAIPFSVPGCDFAYIEHAATITSSDNQLQSCGYGNTIGSSAGYASIYVADQGGEQVFAFILDQTATRLINQSDYLPLRRWGSKAIVATNGQIYYDYDSQTVRWLPLHTYTECHYAGQAVLTTPLDAHVPGASFDSSIPGCLWHRLFLDAQIPHGTSIHIRARAADDPVLLLQAPWSQQPAPYLRSGGAELPYYDPWADMQPVADHTGTWELLFQAMQGRYLQLELTFQGSGRTTPALRALRAWYPRFSYLDHYLPAVYQEDPVSASFLERWLANFEGFYTDLEEKIEQAARLFDPRTAPPETLNWLASWFDLVLDPLWSEPRRRFLLRHVDTFYRWRGTVPGVTLAVRIYLDEKIDESLFDLAYLNTGTIRIIEHFFVRNVTGVIAPFANEQVQALPSPETVQQYAHRFSLFLPHDLSDEQFALVRRIVALEKPAHTEFEIEPYGDLFRVGQVRLGLDTQLEKHLHFTPLRLGSTYLSGNYLVSPTLFQPVDRLTLS